MTQVLEVRDLDTRIDAGAHIVRPLDGVTLDIAAGETFAIVGESGCGKSMTALSIMRLLPESAWIERGAVRQDGRELLALPEYEMREVRGRRIGMIFQEPATSLNPVMTCGAQIIEVLERHRIAAGAAARARALDWLRRVGIPDPEARLDDYPFQLSGGMKQRVMIALALCSEPQLLIADEPTTALDVTIQAQILDLLAELQRANGMAILLITHDLGVVARMAHRVALMYAGEIIEIGTRESFFDRPLHPYAARLFAALPGRAHRGTPLVTIGGMVPALTGPFAGCRFAGRCDVALPHCSEEPPPWHPGPRGAAVHRARCHLLAGGAQAPVPAPVRAPAVPERAPATDPLLEVSGLKVHFPIRRGLFRRVVGHVRAVDGVSFSIGAGRTLALVGESGCGKTTVGKGLLQLIAPSAGAIRFAGRDLAGASRRAVRAARASMQIIFQDPFASLNPRMRVGDIIAEGMASFGLGGDAAGRDARAAALLAQVGLEPAARMRYPHEFSGGQRQRIAIARALAVDPRLIVCDEPTSALDVSVQAQILNLLAELQRSRGVAMLFITHNLAVVEHLADDIAVMYLGRIVESGRADEVLARPRHPYTQALLAAVPRIDAAPAAPADRRLLADPPSPAHPPAGCHFRARCPHARAQCATDYPAAVQVSPSHRVHCILAA
ncbi:MAG: dipeptide ABC transporter ATP-binding protein [Burkholderiales bacterium]|nr:dipeptide ABC transporter ATP-binding protein [Burkholderiales bacterium]